MFVMTEEAGDGEVDLYINEGGAFGGITYAVKADQAPRWRWYIAHRAARMACRGERRADLALKRNYTAACKSCNAGARIAGAVMHALNLHDHRHPTATLAATLTGAAILALGGIDDRDRHLGRLDFEAWAAWRVWCVDVQQKAAA